ncbi:PLP-dependent aminotransferase family protein [Sporomusa sphaeroides]|uniref:HTH-type transcriptional regulator NorG n=1 Tax=Sporomusa sphaeroides DSM 2875 TaxID=1337886 RepID=A0ABP2C5Q8_9FIRM|nr:PLP-dependent aminotransferase family protein [Sporomusa sphaeroides]OLS58745.1 HTH-type transcriptional regulator NorG [Sporomusa sphaeroides DSM 2875]CVK19745.1 HTH-type transcriptional regulator NorG [Sporomusa sphaeroides DSM 2875]
MLLIDWAPNPKDSLPLYQQISEYVKNKIATGEWPINSKLPPQRTLARIFQVNRSTLTIALDELIADGLLESKLGSGTWVANNTWSLLSSTPPNNWTSYLDRGIHLPNLHTIQEINHLEFNPKVICLSTGELSPEIFPKTMMDSILRKLPDRIHALGYEEPRGLLFLREQISMYLSSFGINASPASIMIVSGALQALQLICSSLLPKESTILLEKPSYLFSLKLFQSMNMDLCGIPLDEEGMNMEPISFHKKHKNVNLLYTIPCFHNPTGITMTKERRKSIINICQKEQLPIIEDDVYRELWLDTPPPIPLKALEKEGLVLYLGSLSKSLSPGLRIGWIVGPEPVIERLADIKMQTDYGSSSLSQWAAAEWLTSGLYQTHLEEVRTQLRIRRKVACNALEAHFSDIATWQIPKGGFYIWLILNQAVSMQKLFKEALNNGLLIHPGNIYDTLSNRHLRLSYSYASLPEMENGLFRLSELIKTLIRQS